MSGFSFEKGQEGKAKEAFLNDFKQIMSEIKENPSLEFFVEKIAKEKIREVIGTKMNDFDFLLNFMVLGFMYRDLYDMYEEDREEKKIDQIKNIVETQKMFCYEVTLIDGTTCGMSSNTEMSGDEIIDKLKNSPIVSGYASHRLLDDKETAKIKNGILEHMNGKAQGKMFVEAVEAEKKTGFTAEGEFVSKG